MHLLTPADKSQNGIGERAGVPEKKRENESQMLESEFICKKNTFSNLVQEMVYADKEKHIWIFTTVTLI